MPRVRRSHLEGWAGPSGRGDGFTYRSEANDHGLINLRNRHYDPTTGQFLTQDPLDGVNGTPTLANPYHYTDNDPLNKTDPLGLRPGDAQHDCPPGTRHLSVTASSYTYLNPVDNPPPAGCLPNDDRRADHLRGEFGSAIRDSAAMAGVSAHVLAATIYHEGGHYLNGDSIGTWPFDAIFDRGKIAFNIIADQTRFSSSPGIANIQVRTARDMAALTGDSLPASEAGVRLRLATDNYLSIRLAGCVRFFV